MLESILTVLGSICAIIMFFLSYWHYLSKGSLSSVRKKIDEFADYLAKENIKLDLIICFGRGGFFVGSILTDIVDRKVPLLGIDKAYYKGGNNNKSRIRFPRVEIPESIILPDEYRNKPNILLVTGEIVDGISIQEASKFIKSNIPDSNIITFTVFWSYDSSFEPYYYSFRINGRQNRVPWKKKISPNPSDYPHSRTMIEPSKKA